MPGEYTLKLEKDGYYPWGKRVMVNSSLTTFINDIVLFEKNIPLQIVDSQVTAFYLSPDKQKIIYLTAFESEQAFFLYNLNTKEKTQLYTFPLSEKINLSWPATSKKILVNIGAEENLIIDLQNITQPQNLKTYVNFLLDNVIWDISSDNLLYALKNNIIYKIDLVAKSAQKIFTADGYKINKSFFIEANDLFYIQEAETQNILAKYNFNFQTNKEIY